MDFIDEIKVLSSKIAKQMDMIQTEEATKNAFIMPFIGALGYNVFDPTEVTPELNADIGLKKGEKVDYAILRDGKPVMLFECKSCKTNLDKEDITQLYRYFNATEAHFGIITNGVVYRFYTDLEEPNKMDKKPFLEVNMLDMKDSSIEDLKRFCKLTFNLDNTLAAAAELKYTREIKRILSDQLTNPSEQFVRFFATQVYPGMLTQTVRQQFVDLTKRALNQFINDRINERLKSALTEEKPPVQPPTLLLEKQQEETENKIATTQEEMEGYYIVKSILRQYLDVTRVFMRDMVSCCGILLDDTTRKPICRLYFNNPKKKYFGLFDAEKKEEKVPMDDLNEIYHHAERLQATIQFYDQDTNAE
ncbi:MAG: type I restriction endonuclease [Nanoarchaeota archaeon]